MEQEAEAAAVLDIIRRNSSTGGPGCGSNVYSSGYRHDYDNDSSTDEESMGEVASSDEEQDFVSKYGAIATQTSKRGKVRISRKREGEAGGEEVGQVDSEDDFEADMVRELQERVQAAERSAALTGSSMQLDEEEEEEIGELPEGGGGAAGEGGGGAVKDGKYSEIYFDSDEEEDDRREVKTNDELLYDPEKDEEDQVWVDDVRRSYQHPGQEAVTLPAGAQKLPNSDAVLNCPACFTVVCLDCQRHSLYKTQYRAMFVINCSVATEQRLKFPVNKKAKGKRGPVLDPNAEFHPVKCDQCKTEVAMFDTEEVYHFFNVVASHT